MSIYISKPVDEAVAALDKTDIDIHDLFGHDNVHDMEHDGLDVAEFIYKHAICNRPIAKVITEAGVERDDLPTYIVGTVTDILRKIAVSDRTQAAVWAVRKAHPTSKTRF